MPAQKESTQVIRLRGLMSLASAARMVYARATGRHTDDVATLNNVARLIAAHTRIFELSIDKTAMSVSTETLAAGQLEDGGESLQLKNRAPIRGLAIRRVDLWDAQDEVRKIYGTANT